MNGKQQFAKLLDKKKLRSILNHLLNSQKNIIFFIRNRRFLTDVFSFKVYREKSNSGYFYISNSEIKILSSIQNSTSISIWISLANKNLVKYFWRTITYYFMPLPYIIKLKIRLISYIKNTRGFKTKHHLNKKII